MTAERRGLLYQLIGILVAFGLLVAWLLTADLSDTERQTLDPSTIWGYTVEHLQITVLAALVVLVIAIPLGILLTRPGIRKAAPTVRAIANVGQPPQPLAWWCCWRSGSATGR